MLIRNINELASSLGMLKHLENLYLQFWYVIQNLERNCLLRSVRELSNLKTLESSFFSVEGEFALSNRGETTNKWYCMTSLEAITHVTHPK